MLFLIDFFFLILVLPSISVMFLVEQLLEVWHIFASTGIMCLSVPWGAVT